jgi:putative peptidoglycan lipid II flippase
MTLISRILGFVRDMMVASFFGAGPATDAFFVAFRIPNLFRRLFAEGAFSQAFIPVLADFKENKPREQITHFIGAAMGALTIVLFTLTIPGVLFPSFVIRLLAPGFSVGTEQFNQAADLLSITALYLPLISLTALCSGILNTWGKFLIPAATPALLNLTMIGAMVLGIWWSDSKAITLLAYAVTVAGALQLCFQLPSLFRLGLVARPRIDLQDPGVRRVLTLILPALISASVSQVNLLINTVIASNLDIGSISWLYYADRLVEFPLGILGVAMGSVLLPHLAAKEARSDSRQFNAALKWAFRWTLLLGLPSTLALAILSEPLTLTLFQRHHFSIQDAEMAGRSLAAYAPGLIGFMTIKILTPCFAAKGDFSTPSRYALYAVAINLSVGALLALELCPKGWQHVGLAMATSLAALGQAFFLYRKLKRVGLMPKITDLAFNLRLGIALFVMVICLALLTVGKPWQNWESIVRFQALVLAVIVGLVSFVGCLWASGMKREDLLLFQDKHP